jgi:hypothetical protein
MEPFIPNELLLLVLEFLVPITKRQMDVIIRGGDTYELSLLLLVGGKFSNYSFSSQITKEEFNRTQYLYAHFLFSLRQISLGSQNFFDGLIYIQRKLFNMGRPSFLIHASLIELICNEQEYEEYNADEDASYETEGSDQMIRSLVPLTLKIITECSGTKSLNGVEVNESEWVGAINEHEKIFRTISEDKDLDDIWGVYEEIYPCETEQTAEDKIIWYYDKSRDDALPKQEEEERTKWYQKKCTHFFNVHYEYRESSRERIFEATEFFDGVGLSRAQEIIQIFFAPQETRVGASRLLFSNIGTPHKGILC